MGGNLLNGGTANLSFTTLLGGQSYGGTGNQIYNSGTVNARNVIAADLFSQGDACFGPIAGQGTNWSDDDASCGFSTPGVQDYFGIDGNLTFGIGNTQYHPLLPGSIIVDSAPDCSGLGGAIGEDQEGDSRPLDGNLDANFLCDPGADEYNPDQFYEPVE
jgi:hypothetical protein